MIDDIEEIEDSIDEQINYLFDISEVLVREVKEKIKPIPMSKEKLKVLSEIEFMESSLKLVDKQLENIFFTLKVIEKLSKK